VRLGKRTTRGDGKERGETVRRYPCREELAGMSIANRHLYVNGLIVARASSRAERRSRQSEANETDRLGGKNKRHRRSKKRSPERRNKRIAFEFGLASVVNVPFPPFGLTVSVSLLLLRANFLRRIEGPRLASRIVLESSSNRPRRSSSRTIFDGRSREPTR
jgi:hypothetical protein